MRAKIARHETLAKIKSLRKPRQNKLAKNISTYHDALMRLNAFRVGVTKKEYVRKNLKNLNAPSKQILKYSQSLTS